eukprot:Lithocolla_globosa_v1_NODE_4028_length_1525_cov_222.213605.p1 type:complete len:121 gc:universal NODE_4028_length_1525_cov_222.213605:846-1208(+)
MIGEKVLLVDGNIVKVELEINGVKYGSDGKMLVEVEVFEFMVNELLERNVDVGFSHVLVVDEWNVFGEVGEENTDWIEKEVERRVRVRDSLTGLTDSSAMEEVTPSDTSTSTGYAAQHAH